jgi:hypothetical protein
MLGNHAPQQSRGLGCNRAFSGRIPELAFGRLPWAGQSGAPFAIAAPRTSAPQPRGPPVYPRACYRLACCPLGGATSIAAARNLLQDWRAQDSVAPANGNTRQILSTSYSWPRARIWPLDHGSAALRPDGQTWDARKPCKDARACSAGQVRVKRPVDKCLGLTCDRLAARSRSSVKIDQIGGGFSCAA